MKNVIRLRLTNKENLIKRNLSQIAHAFGSAADRYFTVDRSGYRLEYPSSEVKHQGEEKRKKFNTVEFREILGDQ